MNLKFWNRTRKAAQAEKASERWMNTLRRLGSGGYGCVYEGMNMQTGELVALKSLGQQSETFNREVAVMSKLDHPNVLKCMGSFTDAVASWIVLEYCAGGSLGGLLDRICVLPLGLVHKYLKGILLGLEYLHAKKVVHCDVKPDNILLLPDGTPKLSDFGLSRDRSQDSEGTNMHGSLQYMPPESGPLTSAADIWALGISVVELLDGRDSQTFQRFAKEQKLPEWLPEGVKDFLRHCLEVDPAKRWTATQLLLHPFMRHACKEPSLRKPASPATTLGQLQRLMDQSDAEGFGSRQATIVIVGVPEDAAVCLPGQVAWSEPVSKQARPAGLKSISLLE